MRDTMRGERGWGSVGEKEGEDEDEDDEEAEAEEEEEEDRGEEQDNVTQGMGEEDTEKAGVAGNGDGGTNEEEEDDDDDNDDDNEEEEEAFRNTRFLRAGFESEAIVSGVECGGCVLLASGVSVSSSTRRLLGLLLVDNLVFLLLIISFSV